VSDLARSLIAVENLNLGLRLRAILQLVVCESFRNRKLILFFFSIAGGP